MKIKKRILILDKIGEKLRFYSDDIGENIYKGMTVAIKTKDNVSHKLEDSKSELEITLDERKKQIAELKAKYEKLMKEKGFVYRRLEKAFPNIKEKLLI